MICDLAETYSIYDYTKVPGRFLGTLVYGLGDDSRVKKKYRDIQTSDEVLLLAAIADRLNELMWVLTNVGKEEGDMGDRPKSLVAYYLGEKNEKKETQSDRVKFSSPEEFLSARNEILERYK